MDILKNENSVKIILEKLEKLSGLNSPLINVFSNPLSEARKRERLPREGFIAGGAICNTILSLIDGKNYPINDIDVFYETNTKLNSGANRNNQTNLFVTSYNELISLDSRSESYEIVNTERKGIFNNVYVNKSTNFINENKYFYIINCFDINCCMVGIDLDNNKLVYTKDFEDFLNHRQLMVSNAYTPAHTSLRLIKKKEELNAYLDMDKEMRYLSQLFLVFDNPYKKGVNKIFANFFSDKYKDLFKKYEEKISEYFKILTFLEAKTKSYYNEMPFFEDDVIPKYLRDRWATSNLSTIYPKKYTKKEDYLKYIPKTSIGPISIKKLWNVFERSNNSEINKAKMILENSVTRHFFFSIEGFHKCDFNEKNINDFVSIFGNNQSLIDSIISSKLNLQESLNFIRIIKSISNRESALFVDIIIERIIKDFGQIDKNKLLDKEFIKIIFEEEKKIRSTFLIDPLDLSEFDYKMNVYELATEYDLMFGARILHNCMANPGQGYDKKIMSGECRLFLIETENSHSGIEVEYSLMGFKLKTVLGVTNVKPCEKHVYLANYLVNYLNFKHWSIKSVDIIEKLKDNLKILKDKVNKSDDRKAINGSITNLIMERMNLNNFGFNFDFNGLDAFQNAVNRILPFDDGVITRGNDIETTF